MDSLGLVMKGKTVPLSFKEVSVRVEVNGYVLGLGCTLTYYNDSSDQVEVLFRFPLEKSHAVVGLKATIDGRKVKADIAKRKRRVRTMTMHLPAPYLQLWRRMATSLA